MIEVKGLVKTYGAKRAVDGVSFSVQRGEILGFLGPNGAGKSTTMKMLTGFIRPDAGTATVDGIDVTVNPVAVKEKLGYLPESAPAYPEMTVEEFLGFIAEVRGFRAADAKRAQVDRRHRPPPTSPPSESKRSKHSRRVLTARRFRAGPPARSARACPRRADRRLDPNQKIEVRSLIKSMAATKTIILSTHILEEVEAICTRVIIISRGKVVVDETPAALRARQPGARLDEIFRSLTASDV